MSDEESSKLPIGKAFWALMVLSFVSFLIGSSPDSTLKYKNGLEELKELKKLSRRIDATYNFVAPKVEEKLGTSPVKLIAGAIDLAGKKTISDNVLSSINYFWIDQGPLGFPIKISDLYAIFQTDESYTVRAPNVSQLTEKLQETLKNVPPQFEYISDVDISCNHANLRCNISVTLNNDIHESERHHEEFKIDATVVNLEGVTFWEKIYSQNSYFDSKTIKLFKIEKILYEVYDFNLEQAIKHINVKVSESKGDVSALGVTIKGDSVIFAIPLLVLLMMLMILVCLRELGDEFKESLYLDTPLFYKTRIGVVGRNITYIFIPAGSVIVLVVRFFELNSITSWYGGVFMMGTIACSYFMSKQLKIITMNQPNKKMQPIAGSDG